MSQIFSLLPRLPGWNWTTRQFSWRSRATTVHGYDLGGVRYWNIVPTENISRNGECDLLLLDASLFMFIA
jgi:hypothetical protein